MLAALTDLSMVSNIHHLYAVLAESENMHLWPMRIRNDDIATIWLRAPLDAADGPKTDSAHHRLYHASALFCTQNR